MTDDFVPASSTAPIPGSSYSLRIGKIGDRWAIRVYRGQQILATEVIGELDPQIIVTVAQSAISLPSYSPYHIVRAVSPLIREAKSGYVPPPSSQPTRQAITPSGVPAPETGYEEAPSPASRAPGPSQQPSAIPPPIVNEVSAPPTPRPVEKKKPLVEMQPLEELRVQKRLILEPLRPEELAQKIYSTLMNKLGLTMTYVYKNYGEKSGARMWQYLAEIAELAQSKRKNEGFENFIRRRAEEDMILGIEHQVSEFYENKFVSHVDNCKFKTSLSEIDRSVLRFQQELPCMLCESTWQGSCKAMGLQLQLKKEKEGCTIRVEKIESRR